MKRILTQSRVGPRRCISRGLTSKAKWNNISPQFRRYSSTSGIESSSGADGNAVNGRAKKSTADFGFQDVAAQEKEHLVRQVFSRVASKYDVMNDVMSFGTHRLWKDDLVDMLGYKAAARIAPDYIPRHLDVAGGTGDVAFRSLQQLIATYGQDSVLRSAHSDDAGGSDASADSNRKQAVDYGTLSKAAKVVVCDINPDMLEVGKMRAKQKFSGAEQELVRSSALIVVHC